jgi:hypothetical protein
MTSKTRRRLTFCFVLGLVTLPAEALLLPVARTPSPREAAIEWATAMTQDDLQAAAVQIESYPVLYRRALMAALTPDDRSTVWRDHFRRYIAAHPELTTSQIALIEDAIALASADTFVPGVSADRKAAIGKLYDEARSLLGGAAANELFVTLGPKTSAMASALPILERLANQLRTWRVYARTESDACNCNTEIDTCDPEPHPSLVCSELYAGECEMDLEWPMCGPFWCWACNGWCKTVNLEGG